MQPYSAPRSTQPPAASPALPASTRPAPAAAAASPSAVSAGRSQQQQQPHSPAAAAAPRGPYTGGPFPASQPSAGSPYHSPASSHPSGPPSSYAANAASGSRPPAASSFSSAAAARPSKAIQPHNAPSNAPYNNNSNNSSSGNNNNNSHHSHSTADHNAAPKTVSYTATSSSNPFANSASASATAQPQHTASSPPMSSSFSTAPSASSSDWKSSLVLPPRDTRVQTSDVATLKGVEFEDFHLRRELLKGIFEMGYEQPSPVQEEAIPIALLDKHILARAKNGTGRPAAHPASHSHCYQLRAAQLTDLTAVTCLLALCLCSGKTASFCIPVLEKVDVSIPRTQALVLVPTRELALQTSSVLKKLGKHLAGLTVIVSTGGTDLKEDIIRLMKPCHVIVATPGRILDLANKNVADLSSCGVFVMDEADKLLSPEFVPLIDKLLSFTPDSRQVLCFSATFPRTVVAFRDRWCPDAHEINLMEELTLKGVTQYYAFVDERQKVHCLAEGTLVSLADGTAVPIEEVQVGDTVLSYYAALAAGETEGLIERQVDAVMDQGHRSCVELLFSDGRILVCTADHRIRTADARWVEAGKLTIGIDEVAVSVEHPQPTAGAKESANKDEVVDLNVHRSMSKVTHGLDKDARVLPLFRVRLVGRRDVGQKRVYDLSVPTPQGEESRSFVANGVVVHNCLNTLFAKLDINQVLLCTTHTLPTLDTQQSCCWLALVPLSCCHSSNALPAHFLLSVCGLSLSVYHLLQQCDSCGAAR